jgi:hypothetical protein
LWIFPYWAKIRTTSWKAWVKAEEFLRQRKKVWKKSVSEQSADEVIQQAYDVLLYLPWLGNIVGFDNNEPLHKLAKYASCKWLTMTHQDQMLDLLWRDLLLSGCRIEIKNMAFFPKLQQVYNCRNTGVYDGSRAFTCPHGVALALEAGECKGMGTMVNIDGDHWVAIALNFENSLVWYGDPFNREPVDKVTSVDFLPYWVGVFIQETKGHHTERHFLMWPFGSQCLRSFLSAEQVSIG